MHCRFDIQRLLSELCVRVARHFTCHKHLVALCNQSVLANRHNNQKPIRLAKSIFTFSIYIFKVRGREPAVAHRTGYAQESEMLYSREWNPLGTPRVEVEGIQGCCISNQGRRQGALGPWGPVGGGAVLFEPCLQMCAHFVVLSPHVYRLASA